MVSKLVCGLVFVLGMFVTAFGQQSMMMDNPPIEAYRLEFTGGGARAEGMGKAYLGVSDDNTAGSWNPAGLYELEKPILSLSYSSYNPTGRTLTEPLFTLDSRQLDHNATLNNLTSASFVAPVRIKGHPFVGSVSFTRNFSEYQALSLSFDFWNLRVIPLPLGGSFVDSSYWRSYAQTELEGGLESINFSFGTRVYKNYSFGVALNIFTGTTIRRIDQFESTDSLLSFPDFQILRFATDILVLDSIEFSGFNFVVGMKHSGEKLGAGLVVRTPFSLKTSTGRSIFAVSKVNGLASASGSDTTFFDGLVTKYEIPLVIGGGIAYRLRENFLLALDAEYRGFGATEIKSRDSVFLDPGGDNTEFFTTEDPEWNNVLSIRAGAEYIKNTGIGDIPIRAGFGYVPLPAPSYDEDGNTSRTTSYSLSLGAGLWWSQIHLDWAYTYTTYDWQPGGTTLRPTGQNFVPNFGRNGTYEMENKAHNLSFAFTGYF